MAKLLFFCRNVKPILPVIKESKRLKTHRISLFYGQNGTTDKTAEYLIQRQLNRHRRGLAHGNGAKNRLKIFRAIISGLNIGGR
jgi:hypothetical protein